MDDQQNDGAYINSEGELAEDALYEWDGEQWVTKTHKPFNGFECPLEDPAHLEDLGTTSLVLRNRDLGSYLGALVIMVLSVFTCMLVLLAAMRVQEYLESRPREVAVQPTIIWTQLTQHPIPTPSDTPTPQITVTSEVNGQGRCSEGIFNPAYIFASENYILAQSPEYPSLVCSLLGSGQTGLSPQISPNGTRLYYITSNQFFSHAIDVNHSVPLFSFPEGSVESFELSPNGSKIAYAQDDVLYVRTFRPRSVLPFYSLSETTGVNYPTWSPSSGVILFTWESRIAWVLPDGSDYTIIYNNPAEYPYQMMVAWSPDSSQIASLYATSPDSENRGLLVMNLDGTNVRVVVPLGDTQLSDPIWLPDGEHIAVLQQESDDRYPVITIYDLEGNITDIVTSLYPLVPQITGFDIWYGSD